MNSGRTQVRRDAPSSLGIFFRHGAAPFYVNLPEPQSYVAGETLLHRVLNFFLFLLALPGDRHDCETQWYRDDWPSKPAPPKLYGDAKINLMDESRWDRWDVYNTNFRQWHYRISQELIEFQFDPNAITKPLQLMVGESDDYPLVHFVKYVMDFAAQLKGYGRALTVQDTGHSIHNERPIFLANQIIEFPVV